MIKKIVKLTVLFGLVLGVAGQAKAGWYNTSWPYRKEITIDAAKVTATLTDFPVLIHIDSSDTAFWTHCAGQSEIVFTASNGTTKLNREVEKFDGTNDELVAWVKIPSLSSAISTEIYLYYGNTSASEVNETATWNSNFMMVQHLQETSKGAGAYDDCLDSTANAKNGETMNGVTMDTTGKINGADDFDGVNDYVAVQHVDLGVLDFEYASSFSIEVWIRKTTDADQAVVTKGKAGGTNRGYGFRFKLDGSIKARLCTTSSKTIDVDTNSTYADDTWYHVVMTYDGSHTAAGVKIYVNGVNQSLFTNDDDLGTNTIRAQVDLDIGAVETGTYPFHGKIDEVRISNVVRSSDWITTSYNSQNSPSTFYRVGTEEQQVISVTLRNYDDSQDYVTWAIGSGKGTNTIYIMATGNSVLVKNTGDLAEDFSIEATATNWTLNSSNTTTDHCVLMGLFNGDTKPATGDFSTTYDLITTSTVWASYDATPASAGCFQGAEDGDDVANGGSVKLYIYLLTPSSIDQGDEETITVTIGCRAH